MNPIPVTDVLLAFPADVAHLMPLKRDIPEGYWEPDDTWSCKLFTAMFFGGVKGLCLFPREGVDPETAFRHIKAVMGTFSCKHEYKEATCRYLLDLWFSDGRWE